MQLPHQTVLKNGIAVELDRMRDRECRAVRELFNQVIAEGDSYPQMAPLSQDDFAAYWQAGAAFVVRTAVSGSQSRLPNAESESVVGAFYIKPNFVGRGSHICNAGFIVGSRYRGQGVGRLMGTSVLPLAKGLGYRSIMFNLVFETNRPSIALWRSLGFDIIGRIPGAVRLRNDSANDESSPHECYVDALMFFRNLSDIS